MDLGSRGEMDMLKGLVLARNHSFVRLLAAHKANGNDVALITPTIDFPKTWKKWVLYLSPSGEHNSVMHDNGDANMVSIES